MNYKEHVIKSKGDDIPIEDLNPNMQSWQKRACKMGLFTPKKTYQRKVKK